MRSAGKIHARAHLLAAAEEMAEVDSAVSCAAMIGGKIDGFNVGRPLGDVVDKPAGRGHAAFQPGDAFQEFDALLVFERHILLAGDGHAVDFKPGGEIDGKTANLVVAVVAHGHVVVVDRGIVLHHVGEQARNLVAEQIAGDDGGRKRRFLERRAVERAHGDGFGKIVVFHLAVHQDGGGDGRGFLLRRCGILRGGLRATRVAGFCGAVCAAAGRPREPTTEGRRQAQLQRAWRKVAMGEHER